MLAFASFRFIALATLILYTYAQVQVQFTSYPRNVVAGQTYTITWIPEGLTVTIDLYRGDVSSRNFVDNIRGTYSTYVNSGSLQWVVNPALVSGADYHLFLESTTNAGGNAYSDAITIDGIPASDNVSGNGTGSTPVDNNGANNGQNSDNSADGGSSGGLLGGLGVGGKAGVGIGIAAAVIVLVGMAVGVYKKCRR